jgi:hypothetical protein
LTFSSLDDIIKSTHAIDAKGGRLPIGIPGRLQIGMHGRLRRYPHPGPNARVIEHSMSIEDRMPLVDDFATMNAEPVPTHAPDIHVVDDDTRPVAVTTIGRPGFGPE